MKKLFPVILAAALGGLALTGCGTAESKTESAAVKTETAATAETGKVQAGTNAGSASAETKAAETAAVKPETSPAEVPETSAENSEAAEATDKTPVRVGGLKGPTTMGLVKLMDWDENGKAANDYEFTMVTAADELTALVAGGKVDIALLPANLASVLYNKTDKKISVIDINTLGVLYLVSADTSIQSMDQLKGKTVYLPAKGTTPEFALRHVLSANGLTEADVTLEFKSEPAEVASILAQDEKAVGLLPQPFVASAMAQNDKLSMVMDLADQWEQVQTGEEKSRLVTGVTIVNNQFLSENPEAVSIFLEEHQNSIDFVSSDPETASQLIAAAGIIPKAPLAKKALPYCNIAFLSGEDMKMALSGYLKVLFEQNPASVGGALPEDGFYYIQK